MQVELNQEELFVIMSALQHLTRRDEAELTKQCGTINPLYNKLEMVSKTV